MKNFLLSLLSLIVMVSMVHAQNDTMYIMKQGVPIGKHKLSEIDTIVFYNPFTLPIPLTDSIDIDNSKFLELASLAANYIDSNHSLPLTIIDTHRTVKVNTADFYYMMARWLRWVKNLGGGTEAPPTVKIIRNIGGPPSPSGTTSGTFTKDDLLAKGKSNADLIDTQKYVPNFSTIGTTQYSPVAMFYAWATMINYYAEHTTFPSSVTITTVSAPSTWTSN